MAGHEDDDESHRRASKSHRHRESEHSSSSKRDGHRSSRGGDKERERDHKHHSSSSISRRHESDRDKEHRRSSHSSKRRSRSRSRSPRRDKERKRARGEEKSGGVYDDDEPAPRAAMAEVDFADRNPADAIPTSESLALSSHAAPSHLAQPAALPATLRTGTAHNEADEGIVAPPSNRVERDPLTGAVRGAPGNDMFSSLGREREKKPVEDKPDPEKLHVSKRELNTQLVEGKKLDEYRREVKAAPAHGSSGYQWRMMKLRRVYEAAEEEGRPVEEVAAERYASLTDFNDARAERQFLDDRGGSSRSAASSDGRQTPSSSTPGGGGAAARRSFMFSSPADGPSRPSSRAAFRKPGESAPGTPAATSSDGPPAVVARRFQQSGYESPAGGSKAGTPIPSVFTPTLARKAAPPTAAATDGASTAVRNAVAASQNTAEITAPPLTASALNKLEAKVMRAELTSAANAPALRAELERERARASGGDQGHGYFDAVASHVRADGDETSNVQVLPTLDGRGRLYDVGTGRPGEDPARVTMGNRLSEKNNPDRKKFETHDAKTGELLRYNADDDTVTLAELVRQERFGAGSADQKSMDAELASRIMNDKRFDDNLDYMEENAERLARKKMKTDAMKRQFAVQDFAKTKKALDSCAFCWQDEGARPPRAAVISSGTRAYLALPENEPLVEGHCLIVPMQHYLTSLEADDDTWDEIKNFMKCLMQLAHARKQGVVFYETVHNLKHQRHTVIEAMPVSLDLFQQLPGYFKQEILAIEAEWSDNKKLIQFTSERPFRRAMVPQLPYFMVHWDHKGEKGYGHVIEGGETMNGGEEDTYGIAEASKGGGDFPRWFGAQIIGTLLDLEPRQWRKPRRIDARQQAELIAKFRTSGWEALDWTRMLGQQDVGEGSSAGAAQ